jgi:hypothetical protein
MVHLMREDKVKELAAEWEDVLSERRFLDGQFKILEEGLSIC